MKYYVKHILALVSCLCLFWTPFFVAGYFIYLYWSSGKIHTKTFIIAELIAIILHLVGRSLLPFVRNTRENLRAEKARKGKTKRLTKQERAEADKILAMQNETLLSSTDYRMMLKKGSKKPDMELEQMTGLFELKKSVLRFKAQIQNKKKYKGSMHMCFWGNPGTGKTTVAGIITGFLHQYGYVRKNEYIFFNIFQYISYCN